jgi:hypothetical protein
VIHLAGAETAQPESGRSSGIAARCLALKFPKIVVRDLPSEPATVAPRLHGPSLGHSGLDGITVSKRPGNQLSGDVVAESKCSSSG